MSIVEKLFPEFPVANVEFKFSQSSKQLKKLLDQKCLQRRYNKKTFQVRQIGQQAIDVTCSEKHCTFFMKYKRNQNDYHYELSDYNTQHSHQIEPVQDNLMQDFQAMLEQTDDFKEIRNRLKEKYQISQSQFHYLKKKLQFLRPDKVNVKDVVDLNFKNWINKIEKRNQGIVKTIPQTLEKDQSPQVFICMSTQMIQDYKKYGQCASIVYVDDMINQKPQFAQDQDKKWIIGLICGKNNKNNLVSFAIFSLVQNKENLTTVIRFFLQIAQNHPQTILIEQKPEMQSVIQLLLKQQVFKGNYGYLISYFLELVHPKQRKKQFYKQLVKASQNLRNYQEYSAALEEASKHCLTRQQKNLLQRFKNASHKFLYQQIPPSFVGIQQPGAKIHRCFERMKQKLPFKRSSFDIVKLFYKDCLKLRDEANTFLRTDVQYEDVYRDKGILQVRKSFSEDVVEFFMLNYIFGTDLFLKKTNQDRYQVKQNGKMYVMNLEQSVKTKQKIWTCSCHEICKTGIPCKHLLRLLMLSSKEYMKYIHKRWLIEPPIVKPDYDIYKYIKVNKQIQQLCLRGRTIQQPLESVKKQQGYD